MISGSADGAVSASVRARAWERTAGTALLAAAFIGVVVGGVSRPRWDLGDLSLAAYLAVVSLLLWGQALRIRVKRLGAPRSSSTTLLLGASVLPAIVLGVLDLATGGQL